MAKKQYLNLRWKIAQWAEIRWWKRYLHHKVPEAYLQQKTTYWNRVIEEVGIDVVPGSVVLDAGCGPAGIFMALSGARITAVDPLLESYKTLPHFQPERYPDVTFQSKALEDVDYESVFDQIFCLNVINHVSDMPLALSKMHHALKPGGDFWLSVDAHRFPVLQPVFAALPGDILHPHQYTLPQYERWVQKIGFKIVQKKMLKPGGLFDYWMLRLAKR